MAMKPYSTESYGVCRIFGNQGSNVESRRLVAGRSLSGVTTYHGNRRTPNGQSYTVSRFRGYLGTIYQQYGDGHTTTSGVIPTVYSWSYLDKSFDQNTYNEALGRAYEKLRGSVDLSVDLVQWRKVLQMAALHRRMVQGIAQNAKRLIPRVEKMESLVRDLGSKELSKKRAKRLRRELASATKAIAKARLEFVYGWAPTVSTLQELAKGALRDNQPGKIKVEVKYQTQKHYKSASAQVSDVVPIVHTVRETQRVHVVLWFNPPNPVLDNLARISSLNPLSILYEATPFSFVLDWAVNFSGYIRAMETAFIYRNLFATGFVTRTMRLDVTSNCNGLEIISLPQKRFTTYSFGGTACLTRKNRTILSANPFPTAPVVQKDFGINRTLNALALARVVYPRADGFANMARR